MARSKGSFLGDLGSQIRDLVDSALGGATTSHKVTHQTISYGTGPGVRGEGPTCAESRTVAPFDRIRSALMARVRVRIGGAPRIEVHAQKNLLEYIETNVKDGELVLTMAPGSYTATALMRVVVTVPALSALHMTGHGNAWVTGLDTIYFRLHHSGMGDVDLEGTATTLDLDLAGHGDVVVQGLAADDIDLHHSGMGDVTIEGTANQMKLNGSGHGDLRLADLVVQDVEMTHSGMGDLDLHANGTVVGFASGHGDIQVRGSASWRVRHTGMGGVSFR